MNTHLSVRVDEVTPRVGFAHMDDDNQIVNYYILSLVNCFTGAEIVRMLPLIAGTKP